MCPEPRLETLGRSRSDMLLMIDNYDSFTYNLVQYFGELGEEVRVFRNDEITLEGIARAEARPAGAVARARARRPRPASASPAIRHFTGKLPILGVCLGHQASARRSAASIVRAQRADARQDQRHHAPTSGASTPALPQRVQRDPLPLAGDRARHAARASSRSPRPSEDGEIMGVRHRELAARDAARRRAVPPRVDPVRARPRDAANFLDERAPMTRIDRSAQRHRHAADRRRCATRWLPPPLGDDVFGDDPTRQRAAGAHRRAARQGGGAVHARAARRATCAAMMSALPARRRVHRRPDGAHLPLRSRRRARCSAACSRSRSPHQPDGTLRAGRHRGRDQARRRALRAQPAAVPGEHARRQGAAASTTCAEATALARRRGLATHLDGARLFNAAVALGGDPRRRARRSRSTSTACRCASARAWARRWARRWCGSRELIARAHRWRKMLGGGMRQAGVLAAAALHALDHHVERLADDHALRAAAGRRPAAASPACTVEPPQTNMVFVDVDAGAARAGLCSSTCAARRARAPACTSCAS